MSKKFEIVDGGVGSGYRCNSCGSKNVVASSKEITEYQEKTVTDEFGEPVVRPVRVVVEIQAHYQCQNCGETDLECL